jgi:hypothetical protein
VAAAAFQAVTASEARLAQAEARTNSAAKAPRRLKPALHFSLRQMSKLLREPRGSYSVITESQH